jgi:hypothetical protein
MLTCEPTPCMSECTKEMVLESKIGMYRHPKFIYETMDLQSILICSHIMYLRNFFFRDCMSYLYYRFWSNYDKKKKNKVTKFAPSI